MASLASEERSCPACRRRFASIRTLPTATAAQVNPVRGTALPAARPADERAATRRRGDSGGAARESTVAKKCEQCSSELDRVYGSGRFCNRLCKNRWCQAEGRRRRQQDAQEEDSQEEQEQEEVEEQEQGEAAVAAAVVKEEEGSGSEKAARRKARGCAKSQQLGWDQKSRRTTFSRPKKKTKAEPAAAPQAAGEVEGAPAAERRPAASSVRPIAFRLRLPCLGD